MARVHQLVRRAGVTALMVCVLAACAPSPVREVDPSGRASGAGAPTSDAPRGTLRIAWGPEPATVSPKMGAAGATSMNELGFSFNSMLTSRDTLGRVLPQLAREVPSQDNGTWTVNPDGTMVTTYRLRENAKWHDGKPLTAGDYVFAFLVYVDPEVPVNRRHPENLMSAVRAADDYTLVITWSQLYFLANGIYGRELVPFPAHLLADVYQSDKTAFATSSYWTTEFVGSGPFRLTRWEPGVGATAQAFLEWVLGPPKVATLDIRFMSDANTILANLLSGEIDVSMHPWLSPAAAASARDRWVDAGLGYFHTSESRLEFMDFQFREVPDRSPALSDVRVRQALMYGLDREGLNDVKNFGLGGGVAHGWLLPGEDVYRQVESSLAKYPFDGARASRLLAEAGWSRSGAGGRLLDAGGLPLRMEVRVFTSPGNEQEAAIIADNWKDLGVEASFLVIPPGLASDNEFLVSFPGVMLTNRPISPGDFAWTSRQAPTAQNRWLGNNRGSFADAEIDRLQGDLLVALTPRAFVDATAALHKRTSELVAVGPLFYPVDLMAATNRVTGLKGRNGYPAYSWNIYEWALAEGSAP